MVGGNAAGGGSYGGIGGRPEPTGGLGRNGTSIPASGKTYGTPDIVHLLAGSGGGAGTRAGGGSGAGAIKIVATGTLTIGGDIWAVGGKGGNVNANLPKHGGSGSGGAIYLKAPNLVIQSGVTISADGGVGATGVTGVAPNSSDGGEAGSAAGGGGRIYLEASQSLVNHASSTYANLTASGGVSAGARHGTDGTVKIIRPQVTSLVFTTGTLTLDTDKAEINHSDGSFLAGTLEDRSATLPDGTTLAYKVCVFTADSINLGSGVIVNLVGKNALSLRTRNNGDFTIGTQFIANGGNSPTVQIQVLASSEDLTEERKTMKVMVPEEVVRGMIVFVVALQVMEAWALAMVTPLRGNHTAMQHFPIYSVVPEGVVVMLTQAELVVVLLNSLLMETGCFPLTTSAKISVNGGDAYRSHSKGGGAGSGGAIRLEGGSISCLGTLEARSLPTRGLHAGGGGRIAIQTNGNLLLGTIDLSGYRPGTLFISAPLPLHPLIFRVALSPLIRLMDTGITHQVFMALGLKNRKMTVESSIKQILSPLTLSIWHPD